MRKNLFMALFVVAFCVFVAVILLLLQPGDATSTASSAHISAIMYGGQTNDRWASLDQGIRQACRDLDIEPPLLTSASTEDVGALAQLIVREASSGAGGMLIAVDDSDAMAQALAQASVNIPIVFVKNGPEAEPYVAADDVAMACALAEQLSDADGHIALVVDQLGRESVRKRQDAFMEAMAAKGIEVTLLEAIAGRDIRAMIASELTFHRPTIDVLVALDTDTLEACIDAYDNAMTDAYLCGIGSSDRVVYALNQGIVQSVVFQNEYAIGYIAAMQLAARMNLTRTKVDTAVQYMYVDRETMFRPEAERLLFPINQ